MKAGGELKEEEKEESRRRKQRQSLELGESNMGMSFCAFIYAFMLLSYVPTL